MGDEADNVVLRHLLELRANMDEQFFALRAENAGIKGHVADLRGLVLDTRRDLADTCAELGRQIADLRSRPIW